MPKITKSEAASELRKLAVLLEDDSSTLEECSQPLGSDKFHEALCMAMDALSPVTKTFICRSEFAVEAESKDAALAYALRVAQNHTIGRAVGLVIK